MNTPHAVLLGAAFGGLHTARQLTKAPVQITLIAWLIWISLHVYRLIGFRNRLLVFLNWTWDYLFHENQTRLILKA